MVSSNPSIVAAREFRDIAQHSRPIAIAPAFKGQATDPGTSFRNTPAEVYYEDTGVKMGPIYFPNKLIGLKLKKVTVRGWIKNLVSLQHQNGLLRRAYSDH